MKLKNNADGWFEIPDTIRDKAVLFYKTILGFKRQGNKIETLDMGLFLDSEEKRIA